MSAKQIQHRKEKARREFESTRRVAVLGAGVSGRSAARLLTSLGRGVVIFDDSDGTTKKPGEKEELRALDAQGVEMRWGAASPGTLDGLDALIPSPAIRSNHPVRVTAREQGIREIPEIELAWMHSGRARVVAITGTNGKTTVTMLIRHLLEAGGLRGIEAGNIGLAFCDAVMQAGDALDETIFSLEVSSFQLEECRIFTPEIAVLLNITPDHLDWHGAMEAYAAAKARVTALQGPHETFVANQDDAECLRIARGSAASLMLFSTERAVEAGAWLDNERLTLVKPGAKSKGLLDLDQMPIPGIHNVSNALACACAASAAGVGAGEIIKGLKSFGGAPHRLELIATIGGVRYVNDSKATNIDAMVKAVQSFSTPIHLIAGGRDKDSPFAVVVPQIAPRVARAYLIGEASDPIERAWSGKIEMLRCETIDRALEEASAHARSDEVILLAPACASFDQFRDYAHRGETFRAWVKERERPIPSFSRSPSRPRKVPAMKIPGLGTLNIPVAIFSLVIALTVTGLITVYSASASISAYEQRAKAEKRGQSVEAMPFHDAGYLRKQVMWSGIGLAALFFFYRLDYHLLKRWSRWIMIGCFLGCCLVWVPFISHSSNGSHRWIKVGIGTFQPSEAAKLGLIIYMAKMLEERHHCIQSFFSGVLPAMILTGAFACIIVIEPDFGAAFVLGLVIVGMWICGEMRILHLVGLMLCAVPAGIMAFILEPYRIRRFVAFFSDDPEVMMHEGFQLQQSLIAVGSGGPTGLGLGHSMQRYNYLFGGHTDFIFAILGEETGFIGTTFVLLLFAALVCLGWYVALKTSDFFGSLLATGITLLVFLGAFINMCVVLGLAPTKGLVLPFLSSGGSSLLVTMAGMGILMNIAERQFSIFSKPAASRPALRY